MVFQSTTNYIVRIPDDKLCVAIGTTSDGEDDCQAWECSSGGDDGAYGVTRDVAIKMIKALGDKEIE